MNSTLYKKVNVKKYSKITFTIFFAFLLLISQGITASAAPSSSNYILHGGQANPITGQATDGNVILNTSGAAIGGHSNSANYANFAGIGRLVPETDSSSGSSSGSRRNENLDIESVRVLYVSEDSAAINFTTNKFTESLINYWEFTGLTTTVNVSTSDSDQHTILISGLDPNTLYYFEILAWTSDESTSDGEFTFRTTPVFESDPEFSDDQYQPEVFNTIENIEDIRFIYEYEELEEGFIDSEDIQILAYIEQTARLVTQDLLQSNDSLHRTENAPIDLFYSKYLNKNFFSRVIIPFINPNRDIEWNQAPYNAQFSLEEETWRILENSFIEVIIPGEFVPKSSEGLYFKLDEEYINFIYDIEQDVYLARVQTPTATGTYNVQVLSSYNDSTFESLDKTLEVLSYGHISGNKRAVWYPWTYFFGHNQGMNGAVVSIYHVDHNGVESPWEAVGVEQLNPQMLNNAGEYAFIVPPGQYALEIYKHGYRKHKSYYIVGVDSTGIINPDIRLRMQITELEIVILIGLLLFLLRRRYLLTKKDRKKEVFN